LFSTPTGPPATAPGRGLHHIPGLCEYAIRPNRELTQRALAVLERERPDVVHLHSINNGHLVKALAQRWPLLFFVQNHILTCPSGTRLFAATGELCPQPGPALTCITNAYWKKCNSRRPQVFMSSLFSCYHARAFSRGLRLGVSTNWMKTSLIRSGYPAEAIVVSPTLTEDVPRPADNYPSKKPPCVVFVGQLTHVKGPHMAVRALAALPTPAMLEIAGYGYLRPQLERLVMDLGLEDRVRFHGHVSRSRLDELMKEASVVVMPALWPEPLGIVGVEAMARARPVVAFAVGGIPEWLHDGDTGYLARPNDVGDLADKIELVLSDPGRGRAMGLRGRAVWERSFQPEKHINLLIKIYRELLETA
jgi:glycosyltransferase involved in cell wall biosynthesis